MKAVVCQKGKLSVKDRPDLEPSKGQVLLKVLRCGICGSDLHFKDHCDHLSGLVARVGFQGFPTSADPVILGHEFCGEVLDHGKGTSKKIKAGTRVCAVPMLRREDRIELTGLSSYAGGAYAEQVLVQAGLMEVVPNGLSDDLAAMTEPMAVGLHAVNQSKIRKRDAAVVIGCGPVGLAVILMLKARGVKHIIASDFSAKRRELALQCGAHQVVDPAAQTPFAGWEEMGWISRMSDLAELGVSTREKLGALPIPWWHAWRLGEKAGLMPKHPVIFECVGVPGVLQHIMDGAPFMSRIVVVGVCMQPDQFEPAIGINKELELKFVLGYTPLEYRDALHLMADGEVDPSCLLTGKVGLGGVNAAFKALANPEEHAKILIDPSDQSAGRSIASIRSC